MTAAPSATATATETGQLQHFACPVCGRLRPLAAGAIYRIRNGATTGECQPGHGCRTALDEQERHRRFWLTEAAGVDERDIRRAGGARAYVDAHGLPELLHALADVLPADAPAIDQRRKRG